MPFDGTTTDKAELAVARFRLKPTLGDLEIILRNPHVWPKDFTFCYIFYGHCAVGLAAALLGESWQALGTAWSMRTFGISQKAHFYMMGRVRFYHQTPTKVADRIAKYLAAQGA